MAPRSQCSTVMMTTNGPKYDKTLSSTEIAVRVRGDIKAAIIAGNLPRGLKVSVRTKYFAGGSSITCEVTAVPVGMRALSVEFLRDEIRSSPWARYTHEAKDVLDKIEALLNAYNFDGSDSQSDYFHVNFYTHVKFAFDLEQAERRAIAMVEA